MCRFRRSNSSQKFVLAQRKTSFVVRQNSAPVDDNFGRFDTAGKLTTKGMSKLVLVSMSYSKTASGALAQGSFVIPRGDFKIGEGDGTDASIVATEVQVKFKLTLASP